eukprot:4808268-Prymnesium_polylepis.1
MLACAATCATSFVTTAPRVGLVPASSAPLPQGCAARAEPARMSVDVLVGPYLAALDEHYFTTTATQALLLVGSGDVLAQQIELNAARKHGEYVEYDPTRTARMAALGMLIGGFGTARWLQFLEYMLPADAAVGYPGYSALGNLPTWLYAPLLRFFAAHDINVDLSAVATADLVVIKAILDACFWAPLANTAYLVLTPLLEGKSVENVQSILSERFVPVMKTELATFFPYNLVSFSLIPPLVRPFTTGFISM